MTSAPEWRKRLERFARGSELSGEPPIRRSDAAIALAQIVAAENRRRANMIAHYTDQQLVTALNAYREEFMRWRVEFVSFEGHYTLRADDTNANPEHLVRMAGPVDDKGQFFRLRDLAAVRALIAELPGGGDDEALGDGPFVATTATPAELDNFEADRPHP